MAVITFPKILIERLTDEGARALADILNTVENTAQQSMMKTAEDRFERRLTEEAGKLRLEIQVTRTELIKWMFIFWVGQAAMVIGIMQAFLSKH